MNRLIVAGIVCLAVAGCAVAQPDEPSASPTAVHENTTESYVLGPGDKLTLFVADLEEFNNRAFRIDGDGFVKFPLAGRIKAGGLSTHALEKEVAIHLKQILKDPEVVINVSEFESQPVSILGAVGNPGVRQIENGKTLYEVISLAGGLRQDAGNTINISRDLKRGPVPLKGAKVDPTGRFSIGSVSVKTVLNATDPAANIEILPGDVVSVSQANIVYAVGEVLKPGGFPVGQNDTLSALQVLSLAGGVAKTASTTHAVILRSVPGSSEREQIPVNLKELMAGKSQDLALEANDILFVPNSRSKVISSKAIETIVSITAGMATYGRL